MADAAPALPSTTPDDKKKYPNPWGFGQTIGTTVINGSQELVFGPQSVSWGNQTQIIRHALGIHNDVSADTLMSQFVHMTGMQLAAIQSKLYRSGGFYDATFVPTYGTLRAEDVGAMKKFLIGAAMNPTADKVGNTLDTLAAYGDKQGVNLNHRAPLVVKLTSPDDIRAAADKAALDLYGGNLSEEEMQRFITSFQSLQGQAQTSAYNLGDPSLTGTLGGLGGTVVAPPSLETAAANEIKKQHPDQVFTSALGKQINDVVVPTFTGTTPGAPRQ